MNIDKKYYNYKYLSQKDKEFIDGMWWSANMVLANAYLEDIINPTYLSSVDDLVKEIGERVKEDLRQKIALETSEIITSMLDNEDDEVYEKRKAEVDAQQDALGDIQIGDIIYDCDGECLGKVVEITTNSNGEKCYKMDTDIPIGDFSDTEEPILVDEDNELRALWLVIRK